MKISKGSLSFTTALLLMGLTSSLLPKKSEAGVGLILVATAKGNATQTLIGEVIGGAGLIATLASFDDISHSKSCTPSDPCTCTSGSTGSSGSCDVDANAAPAGDTCTDYDCDGNCDASVPYYAGTQASGSAVTGYSNNNGEMLFGLIMLGTEASPQVEYQAVTHASAQELGLTLTQEAAFNKQLPQINLIANTFLTQLKQEADQGSSSAQIEADSKALWATEGKPVLSADAYVALQTLSTLYVQQLKALK